MRTNGEFLSQLRDEIADGQQRRAAYIKIKLSFIVGLLGVGAFSLGGPVKTSPILYLVPLVAFIFDLYILGEDFGIKRAGIFIGTSNKAPEEERIWENNLSYARDKLSFLAGPISTFASVVAAIAGLIISGQDINNYLFIHWVIVALLFVLFPFPYISYRNKKLNSFSTKLNEIRSHEKRAVQ